MDPISKVKSLIPASSRSLHAMHYELGQMHGQMGEMWSEVGLSRLMIIDLFGRIDELSRHLDEVIGCTEGRTDLLLWALYRREGEGEEEAKRRLYESMPHASGDMRLYQLASVRLLADFDAFCAEHDLAYWLVSGTLLGAVRHGGFIPWDDDLDVGMPRQDIERIIELAREDDRFEVTVRYDFYVNCRQVRFRYADAKIPCFVDLFYFDPVARLDTDTFVAREAERAQLEADLGDDEAIHEYWNKDNQFVDEGQDGSAPIGAHFDEHIAALYERGLLVDSVDEAEGIIWGIDNVNSGVAHHTWYLIPREAIFPLERMAFESCEANVPHDRDRCLSDIFGDIYDLPPKVGSYFDHFTNAALRDEDTRAALVRLAGQDEGERR